ncbi:YhcH/YjgK/YiaL family protein [Basfia succiniciproducens]|uniref:YhcH/YjgK/YiaL family protein n=1 Tax=Basfia succiniciproducens TaxID=653940 RepID=A0A1G5CQU1_9PAST|nr:YhcH/YjgK/YiaL family protein [Basfia succiniciproducens]QIM69529.1 EbgC protein [Basfia succiniciproducens]SCY04825.1 YhcH/YjgK/YiaL family protein [Basfia succiniciproducens]
MIFGHIAKVNPKQYPQAIRFALDYLAKTDFDSMEVGRYPLKGDKIYVQVLDLETKPKAEYLPEVHRNYLDVQYLHSGTEIMGVSTDLGNNAVAVEYNPERDILYYAEAENEQELHCQPGNFAVFFPEDAHRAAIYNGSEKIRKIVVKIAMSEI